MNFHTEYFTHDPNKLLSFRSNKKEIAFNVPHDNKVYHLVEGEVYYIPLKKNYVHTDILEDAYYILMSDSNITNIHLFYDQESNIGNVIGYSGDKVDKFLLDKSKVN